MVVHGSNSKEQHPKCIHGECAFIWPLIQSYEFLNLNPIPIDISFEGNLLRLALASKISREEFIKFYVGNEINPNLPGGCIL